MVTETQSQRDSESQSRTKDIGGTCQTGTRCGNKGYDLGSVADKRLLKSVCGQLANRRLPPS